MGLLVVAGSEQVQGSKFSVKPAMVSPVRSENSTQRLRPIAAPPEGARPSGYSLCFAVRLNRHYRRTIV